MGAMGSMSLGHALMLLCGCESGSPEGVPELLVHCLRHVRGRLKKFLVRGRD